VAIVGAVTALYAASIGLVQNDIKRVLAYSTISQLGYMFLGAGVGAYAAGIFHLTTHAFFKALLFLAAGSVMHALGGETDIRKMGGLKDHISATFWVFTIGVLALSGFPFLSGFFSKDEILGRAFLNGPLGQALWAIGLVAALLTALYSFRLVFVAFMSSSRVESEKAHHLHESPPVMIAPLVVLAFLSVIGGYIGLPKIMGGNNRFEAFLGPVFGHHEVAGEGSSAVVQWLLVAVAVSVSLIGLGLAYRIYLEVPETASLVARRVGAFYRVLLGKYYVDEAYRFLFVRPAVALADGVYRAFDVRVVDGAVNGIARLVGWGSGLIRRLNTGYVRSYAFYIFLGAVAIIGYYIFR
jgi:NADH-quinone oxidoreductase subunit L